MGTVEELRLALTVSDFAEALAFYRDALGLEQTAAWESANGRVAILEAGRATLELLDERQAETIDGIEAGRRVAGPVRIGLEVEDSEATARRLIAAGAVTTPWRHRNVRLAAPQGMQLTLFTVLD